MPDIMHLFKFAVPREQAYQAIATADGIRKWWTSDADLEAFAGGQGEFRFYGGQSVHKVNVVESVLPQRIAWDVRESFRQEWVGTNIVFSLRPDDNGTELLFAHRGFLKADEAYALFTTGWGIYLASLKEYLEKGQGTPR